MSDIKLIILDIGYKEDAFGLKKGTKVWTKEFKFNSKVAKLIKKILELNGVKVILTQPLNTSKISLNERIILEKELNPKADGLVSMQADWNSEEATEGSWIFYWHTSQESGKLAALIDRALVDCSNNEHRDITASMPDSWNDFQILRETNCPSVLIEYGYIDNKDRMRIFRNRYFALDCAKSTSEGILQFLGIKNYTLKTKGKRIIKVIKGLIKLLNKILNKIEKGGNKWI